MNPREPIQKWREQPTLSAATQKGWTVIFAADNQGRYPALDYMDGIGGSADPEFPFDDTDLRRLSGLLEAVRWGGPAQIRDSSSFVNFVGADARNGMCELRIIPKKGHRFLCFQCGEREFLVTHAFRKPPQRETPPSEKTAALRLLEQHKARTAERLKHSQNPGKKKDKR